MNSSTKINVSEITIKNLIKKAEDNNVFNLGRKIETINIKELTNGYFNTIYLLQLDSFEVILKIAPPKYVRVLRYEKNIMKAEVEALNAVNLNTNLPVPQIYFYDGTGEIEGLEYILMKKINGDCLNTGSNSIARDEKQKIEFELGGINNEINKISNIKFGYLAQAEKQSSKWGEAFFNIVSDILEDGKDANVALPYDEIEDIFKRFLYVCDDIKKPQLVHWDLWPGNVLIENGRISGIIDFERSLWADPLMEYYFSNLLNNKNFCAGYGINLNDLDENSKIRRSLYNLYLYLVLKIECYYRNYVDSSQNTWAEKCILQEIKKIDGINKEI